MDHGAARIYINSVGGSFILEVADGEVSRMTEELKQQLLKRLYSYLWRVGAFVVVTGLAIIVDVLTDIQANPLLITAVALLAGEATKFVNSYLLAESGS